MSVRCRPLLDGDVQELDVLAVLPAAVYLATREPRAAVIALLAADAVVHPAAFVLAAPIASRPFAGMDRATASTIGGGQLRIGGFEIGVGRWYDPVPALRVPAAAALVDAVDVIEGAIEGAIEVSSDHGGARTRDRRGAGGERSPQQPQQQGLEDLARALERDDAGAAVAAVAGLIGSGPGLTPTGDDQLAGLLATLHLLRRGRPAGAAERAVREHVRQHARSRTTLLSAALLEHALEGAVAAPVARLLRIVTAGGPSSVGRPDDVLRSAVTAVLCIGATSGRDLLAGIAIALRLAGLPSEAVAAGSRTRSAALSSTGSVDSDLPGREGTP